MNRRGFLQAILAAGVAPWVITKAGVLMPVRAIWKPLNPLRLIKADASWYPHRSGKSWFIVQEAVRRARERPNDRIAILSYYEEPIRTLIETIAAPEGQPGNLIHVPSHTGENLV